MSIGEEMEKSYQEDALFDAKQCAKCGDYENPGDGCPNCGRYRVMLGADGKHRCEKCGWCVEDGCYDTELLQYLR